MSKAIKGAVLSGLVLPGLGQLVLKHYLRGGVLLLASLACLVLLVEQATEQATAIIGKIDLNNGAIDPVALLNTVNQAGDDSAGSLVGIASLILMVLWLGGTIDAYLLGRKEDLREQAEQQVR